jgi:L-lactate dehydrogenase (cytochrome)/(S)-mandelate dehydrogenase
MRMGIDSAVNIEDLHRMAKRRLPKVAFDLIEGGLEDERGLDRNTEAFKKHQLVPRYLVDVSKRDQTQTIFGRTYGSPFGIAPTGVAGLFRHGADMMLARAAVEADIPYIMSGASNDSLETAAKVAPRNAWYQLYAARDPAITDDLVRRTADAGLDALVLTVDVPVRPKRERNLRNGSKEISGHWLQAALSLKPRLLAEAITHPAWVFEYVRRGGMPMMENWQRYAKQGATPSDVVANNRTLLPAHGQTWSDLERYRRLFPRRLIIKGIMHPADAVRCVELGCDGIIVSNHGARQLDQAPSPLDMLPVIKEAVGDRMTVMLDSGVRRGADVLIALCLGAQFVFTGRATLYGVVAGGQSGVKKAVDIVRGEIDMVMGQIGCPSLDKLGPDFLWPAT